MSALTTVLLVSSLAATAIGAGVSAYGQTQQGKSQQAIASFNAMQQEKQARAQLLGMQTQSALQQQQAEANFKLRSAEAAARNNNADAFEAQANQNDKVNRINLMKRREEFSRMQAGQRATIAASGATESSGTPLDILAETAAKIQMSQEDQLYAGEVERRSIFSEAAQERLGGKLALAGATLNRDSEVAAAGLRNAAGKSEYLAGLRGAEITRLTGAAAKSQAMYGAASTIFSAAGSMASTGMTYKRT